MVILYLEELVWMDGCRVRDTVILGREKAREEGGRRDASLSFHVGKQEITREGREGCDSVSAVIQIVSPLRAQRVPSYVPPIPLPLATGTGSEPNGETALPVVSYPMVSWHQQSVSQVHH